MIVAALLVTALGGFAVAYAQARPFDFDQRRFVSRMPGEGGLQRRPASPGNGEYSGLVHPRAIAPAYAPRNRLISPAQAVRRAQQRYGGRVLSVELVRDGAPYYRVKLLRNGNVRVVRVSAGR
ncbi:MAG: hypothetical protein L0H63_11990 [Nitrococcus sp.]|nr:hypothetical protein [Nitrococcus sp.]